MGNWKYFELIATFYKVFINFIGQGVAFEEALNRAFNDFWFFPEDQNLLSNLVILIQFIQAKFAFEKNINDGLIDLFHTQIAKVSGIKLEEYLDSKEGEHLRESIDEIKYRIRTMNRG